MYLDDQDVSCVHGTRRSVPSHRVSQMSVIFQPPRKEQAYRFHCKSGIAVDSLLNILWGICDAQTDSSPSNFKIERTPDKLVQCLSVFRLFFLLSKKEALYVTCYKSYLSLLVIHFYEYYNITRRYQTWRRRSDTVLWRTKSWECLNRRRINGTWINVQRSIVICTTEIMF
jgi:hypothetical protein